MEPSDLLNLPGVYRIQCKATGQCYVGSTIRPIPTRVREHLVLLEKQRHPSALLQELWNTYGEEGFSVWPLRWPVVIDEADLRQAEDEEAEYWQSMGLLLNQYPPGSRRSRRW